MQVGQWRLLKEDFPVWYDRLSLTDKNRIKSLYNKSSRLTVADVWDRLSKIYDICKESSEQRLVEWHGNRSAAVGFLKFCRQRFDAGEPGSSDPFATLETRSVHSNHRSELASRWYSVSDAETQTEPCVLCTTSSEERSEDQSEDRDAENKSLKRKTDGTVERYRPRQYESSVTKKRNSSEMTKTGADDLAITVASPDAVARDARREDEEFELAARAFERVRDRLKERLQSQKSLGKSVVWTAVKDLKAIRSQYITDDRWNRDARDDEDEADGRTERWRRLWSTTMRLNDIMFEYINAWRVGRERDRTMNQFERLYELNFRVWRKKEQDGTDQD